MGYIIYGEAIKKISVSGHEYAYKYGNENGLKGTTSMAREGMSY
jgi:hypothetical protein